ncbi:leucine-rich repeat-containing protein 56 isoform X2 [Astatotilapia calliptera]|uniref:leucine-rich repeat-containing protein 56 isoform X2 n=1 Tax=Astatotilapia calliptera TaxID=8154 RepID=UPI000E41B4FF|nr:leucine-rich repeat-containing protein 56 isoform X2 [Astatotilapia calliptera]
MSYCHGSVPHGVRSGTARVLVTELSGSGSINPTPASKPCEDSETPVEFYLSPEKLKLLCGTQDLSNVTSLEICVDTQENTLGNFGVYLPGLVQLKMNNSRILSVRDLGTTISQLQELYLSYNNVSDLSQVGMLENLQLLDLEGNDVDDLVQVQYLSLCSKLERLTLEGNPVCLRPNPTSTQMADYSYRAAVRELVPQLRYLDDVKVEEDRLSCCTTMGEDWDILRNSIRDSNSSYPAGDEETTDSVRPYSRPSSATCPSPSFSGVWAMSSSGTRPHSGSRLMSAIRPGVLSPSGSRPGSADSDLAVVEAETSNLTHRAGNIIFCGNPVQAIRAKRQKLRTAPTRSTFTPRDTPIHVPEHTYDLEEPDLTERADVFAELRAWKEQHSRRLEAIAKDRLPQILSIQHSDDEEARCDEEEDGCGAMRSDSSNEEHEEEKKRDNQDAASLDFSFQSLSPDLLPRKNLPSDMARLSLVPKTAVSPSPPLKGSATAVDLKPQGIRARRLHLSQARPQYLPEFSSAFEICRTSGDTDKQMSVPPMTLPAPIPHPPPTAAPSERLKHSRVKMDSGEQPGQKCEISKILKRPAITRPHTARAALQKHHQHHILQSCRGSSQPD